MKKSTALLIPLLLSVMLISICRKNTIREKVIFDYTGAEKMIEWLQMMKTETDEKVVETSFFTDVVTTEGYQAVLRHWSRLFEWNEEILYDWLMVRLGRKQFDEPVIKRDENKMFYQ